MTDERSENEIRRGRGFDDDRLLALALGLDDDPELAEAAAADAELGARLAAMRADVSLIGAQIGAAVPPPDDAYSDASAERWSGLAEFFEPPARTSEPRRQRRWWRVAAPVAALVVLAVVVGIVAIDRDGSVGSGSSSEAARSADGSAQPANPQSLGTSKEEGGAGGTIVERLADELDRFAIIVLARAREATGALQRFAVVRVFKGDVPDVVALEVDGKPADRGRLHLLMLDPVATGDAESGSPEPIPSPATTKGEQRLPGKPLAVAYTYGGEPTMVRELAAGADPDSVDLSIP